MKKYWKVHISDLPDFLDLGASQNQIETWTDFCNRYNDHIYLIKDDITSFSYLRFSYMPYEKDSIEYFKSFNYIYMGDFNLKRNRNLKLEKLNERSSN